MKIILNGRLMAAEDAHISPFDRGLNLGDSVFDTMLCRDGRPVVAHRHFTRLAEHAKILGIPYAYHTDELLDWAHGLLRANDFTTGSYALRTTLTHGPSERGLLPPDRPVPTLIMRASPAPVATLAPSVIIAKSVRRNEFSPLSRIKSTNYGDNILALQDAQRAGADDALMLNTRGSIACAAAGNILVLLDGQLVTPPQEDGAMGGIVRGMLLEHGRCKECTIMPEQIEKAEAIFICNSLRGIQAVSRLDGCDVRQAPDIHAGLVSFLDNQAAN